MEEVFDDRGETSGAIDRASLKALCRPSDARGLFHLATHLGAIALTGAAILAAPGLWWLPLLPLQGFFLVSLFAPLHESLHRTAFRSRWLNEAVAWLCGAVLILPPGYFRAFHFAHHRYTQDPRRDPELASPKPTDWAGYLKHLSGIAYWRERVTTTVKQALGQVPESFVPERQKPLLVREARILLGLYALLAVGSVALGSAALLWVWLLPALFGQPFLRAYLLAEHGGCPEVPDMLRNTRTTLTTPFVRWFFWNMPFHVEHHAYPAVPFHALPQAHALIRDRIEVHSPGYLAVHLELTAEFGKKRGPATDPARP